MRNIKPLLSIFAAVICMALFIQCSSDKYAGMSETSERPADTVRVSGIRIAYINLDTVMYCYEFALDINKEMISKESKIISTLESKRKAIEEEVANFEYKCNSRIFPDEESYINEREEIMRKEKEFMDLRDRLYSEWEKENHDKGKELRDSINSFIKEYNGRNGYDFILTKIGDNILYANDTYNITMEIVDGLNKRYSGNRKAK